MKWLRYFLFPFLLLALSPEVSAQTTTRHPSKVEVKPTTPADNSLRVWGGIQFGASGATQLVTSAGEFNASLIGAGALDKSQLGDSGCSSGQILKFNGTSWACDTDVTATGSGTLGSISLVMPSSVFDISPGTLTADGTFTVTFDSQTANTVLAAPNGASGAPSFRALVAADLPSGLVDEAGNEIITGNWEFRANTLFGPNDSSAQRPVHVYTSASEAAIRIERGDAGAWELSADSGPAFTVRRVSGNNYLTLRDDRLGVLDTTPSYTLDVNGTGQFTGTLGFGNIRNGLYPDTNDVYPIGSNTARWSEAHISTIYATIFAEETAQLFGGYQIVGKNTGTFAAAVSAVATTIDIGKNITPPFWILVRGYNSAGAADYEYITVNTLSSGTTYNVTRDASDGTSTHTDPAWPAGTPYLVLGNEGDGRIETYANSGFPKMSFLRQGATPNAATEYIRLGILDDITGASTGRFGIFAGDASSYLKYQHRFSGTSTGDDNKLVVKGEIKADSGWFGSDASNHVEVGSTGLTVVNTGVIKTSGKDALADTSSGFFLGGDGSGGFDFAVGNGSNYLAFDSSAGTLTVAGNGSGLTSINGGNIQTDTITASQIAANAITASELAAGSVTAADIAADTITATEIAASAITATEIAAGAVTAAKISVTDLAAVSANMGALTVNNTLTMSTGGVLKSGATSFTAGTGYWLGHNAGSPQFRIGDTSAKYLSWDGTTSEFALASEYVTIGESGIAFASPTHTSSGWSPTCNFGSPTFLDICSGTNNQTSGYMFMTGPYVRGGLQGVNVDDTTDYFEVSLVSSERLLLSAATVNVDAATSIAFDTNTLYVDPTNNRVGVKTTSPGYAFQVAGDAYVQTSFYVGGTAGSAGTASSGVWLGGVGVGHGNLAWLPNENTFALRTGNTPTATADVYGAPNLDLNGFIDAAGGFKVNGMAGISTTITISSCTITVTNGLITGKSGSC